MSNQNFELRSDGLWHALEGMFAVLETDMGPLVDISKEKSPKILECSNIILIKISIHPVCLFSAFFNMVPF